MKVLMYGWEFPPHISGGLGTASYGLTRGMLLQEDLEISFVVPRTYGDEQLPAQMKLIGVDETPIVYKELSDHDLVAHLSKPEHLAQYRQAQKHIYADFSYRHTSLIGTFEFAGGYPSNLLEEINNYSIAAGVIARSESFDIIHSHDWLTYPAGIHTKQVSGKPLVIHVHATDFDRSRGNVNPQVYAIEREGMNHADAIITVSNLTRQTVIEKYHQPPHKVITVHNAVEPLNAELLALPNKSGVPDKVITFLGRITMQKGPEYFVEAAAKVLQHTRRVRFIMAGNGDMMHQMINLVAHKQIADRFHFTGFMRGKEVYEVLKASDVYVMPSVSEPFGISPLEAMQCGVPSIISKQSGCSEILQYAIKTDYWDVDAIADAMYALITYPQLHDFLKQAGLEEVNNITWEAAGQKVREIYQRTITAHA